MAEKTKTINMEVYDSLKRQYPSIDVHKPRIAEGKVVDEFRKMKIGDIVVFPTEFYNYQTIRSCPASCMIPERLKGWNWRVKLDIPNKAVSVIRLS